MAANSMRDYYGTPKDWHGFLKYRVIIQVHGHTYEGWLNNINTARSLIGIDQIPEEQIWEMGADPNTQWFPMRDTLLCQYSPA